MSMTIRERMREVAILKSMGYTRRTLLFLVLGESVFIAMLGLATGIALAMLLGKMDMYALTRGSSRSLNPRRRPTPGWR
jgi:ABC-type antimicrobial peptide transport system permease subunit